MLNAALMLTGINGSWSLSDRAVPSVTNGTLLVRVHALALNPIDWKIREKGHYIKSWPAIIGSDVAGTVEAVGSDVEGFEVGDRIVGFAKGVVLDNPDCAAFQTYMLLHPDAAGKIPENVTFQQAATLPMAVATAAGALRDLGVNLPGAPPGRQAGTKTVLIWGASSSVGSAAVQLARMAGTKVFATASPSQHESARQMGAEQVFDYRSPTIVDEIKCAADKTKTMINKVLDAVSVDPATTGRVLHALGGGQLAKLGSEDLQMPDGVDAFFSGARSSLLDYPFSEWLFRDCLPEALSSGNLRPALVEVVPGGLLGIEKGLEMLRAGVNGVKLVVEL